MSRRTIFALKGVSNTGKTQTINFVRRFIEECYKDCKTAHDPLRRGSKEITLILQVGNTKIGIESQGDPNSRLFNSIPYFVNQGCDIIVCATRTRGATVELVKSYEKYEIKWYSPNAVSSGAVEANTQKAQEIFTDINKLID